MALISVTKFSTKNKRNLSWTLPGRSGALPPLSPLRTARDSFPSYGSSLRKVSPYGATRWTKIHTSFTILTDSYNAFRRKVHQLEEQDKGSNLRLTVVKSS